MAKRIRILVWGQARAMGRTLAVVVLCMATGACVGPTRYAAPGSFSLSVTDNPADKQFDLVLNSAANAPLCLAKETWPAESGVPLGFDGAVLQTPSGSRSLQSTGSAYCPGGCGELRIEPGRSLRGVVPYRLFGDEGVIAAEAQRTLRFEVHPWPCGR